MNERFPRVLMFTATLGYGGAESAFLRLAQYLSRHMTVTIALMARDYGSSDYVSAQSQTDLPVVMLDDAPRGPRGVIGKLVRWGRMLRKLRAVKRQHDVTISFLSGPNLLNALAGHSTGTIVSERGSKLYHVGIPSGTKAMWLRVLDPITYRLAGTIVPASNGYVEEIVSVGGPRIVNKIRPIEGGIDASALLSLTDARADDDIEQFTNGPTAVYCGRLDRGKGIDLLIPVFARVRREIPDAKLLVLGDGPLRSELINACAAEGLKVTTEGDSSASVFLAGYREDPMRHFRLCQVFCFPSLHEGLGNALIEGVASGIPVLAADCPWGPRSILTGADDNNLGPDERLPKKLAHGTLMPLITEPGGKDAWYSAIRAELLGSYRRRTLENRAAAVARFDLEETGKLWVELISKSISSRQKSNS